MTSAPREAARAATPGDVGEVVRLIGLARAELASERGGLLATLSATLSEPLAEDVRARLTEASCLVVVGTLDDAVVGTALAHRQALADERAVGAVDLLYVEQEARAIGVGEALLDCVLDWGAAAGCTGIDVPALPGMRASKNFLEGAGFVARLLVMHRRVGP